MKFGLLNLLGIPNANGIKFPSVQVPSADVNTLDWYKEGTFVPTLTFGGGSTGMTYNTQYGAYTRIGNLVHVEIIIILTAKGSSTGNALISTLPFTTNSVGQTGAIYFENVSYTGSVLVYLGGSATTINLEQLVEAGTSSAITHANFANNSYLNIVLSYIAT